jgi:hypothetical protein
MPTVRAVMRDAARQDYRLNALIEGITTSTPFLMRLKASDEVTRVAAR